MYKYRILIALIIAMILWRCTSTIIYVKAKQSDVILDTDSHIDSVRVEYKANIFEVNKDTAQ